MGETLCPRPDVCGCCGWAHIPYERQLQQKLSDINGSFKLKELTLECHEILPSPATTHYRNRMDFAIDYRGNVGMREKGKWWRVIDNHTCFIADPQIDNLYVTARSWAQSCGLSFYDRKSFQGLLRYAVIRATLQQEQLINIITSVPSDASERERTIEALRKLASAAPTASIVWSTDARTSDTSTGQLEAVISGRGSIDEQVSAMRYRITPGAFFQTNSHASPLLMNTVADYAGGSIQGTLLDLYCGTGFFSVALANRASRTIGVEIVGDAVKDAVVNAERNGVSAEFIEIKTEDYSWRDLAPAVVIVDPPRPGLHDKALKTLIEALPPRIVYVSCNYKSFAREMTMLKDHYNVEALRAIDQFPHTPHVELVALLERKRG